jgi:hypothetical protein
MKGRVNTVDYAASATVRSEPLLTLSQSIVDGSPPLRRLLLDQFSPSVPLRSPKDCRSGTRSGNGRTKLGLCVQFIRGR